jgi:hypothetical protein
MFVSKQAILVMMLAVATGAAAGCGSTCAANCPTNEVRVQAADTSKNLSINYLFWGGPACPQYSPGCGGDGHTTMCTHVDIVAAAPGECDLEIVFADRPAEVIRAQFGPAITQGCCVGYGPVGDSLFIIPTDPSQSIYGADGGSTDAITVLTDGSADGADGGTDAAADAPADAPAAD